MKGGTRAAVAIGMGYVLGRRRKMRLATILAVGAATGGAAGLGGSALRRGAQALGSTEALGKLGPQFGEIADTVRGDLVEAGKAAAVGAVTGRIDALTDSLHDRAESLRNPAAAAAGAGEAARSAAGRGAGQAARGAAGGGRAATRPGTGRRRRDEDQAEPEDEPGYDEPGDQESEADSDWDEDDAAEDQADEADQDEADDDEADDDERSDDEVTGRRPAPARRRGSPGRAPASRARR